MKITLNGTPTELGPPKTVAELVGSEPGIAVAVNGEVLPRGSHDQVLVEGDTVEVVTAVQGG